MMRNLWTQYRGLTLIPGMVLAVISSVVIMLVFYRPPSRDIGLLIVFTSCTAIFTLWLGYFLYQSGFFRRFHKLHYVLSATTVLTVALIFINVWVVARLMFTSEHDLVLITALLVFAGILAITFGYFIASSLMKQIQDLKSASRQLASGDLAVRLHVEGNDELADLAVAFNDMAMRLQSIEAQKQLLEQTRRDLVAWVSHDLRTPLTSMRAMLEAVTDEVATGEEAASYLRSTQTELGHLTRLIDDLFELAQIDAGSIRLDYEPASLAVLIRQVLESKRSQAEQDQIELTSAVDPQIGSFDMDISKVRRVLHNLVENALHYTPPRGCVEITAQRRDSSVWVDIVNTGPRISDADLPRLFERFYRGGDTRSYRGEYRGAGLGLAITQAFVRAHGGAIHVENVETGVKFTFTLPYKA